MKRVLLCLLAVAITAAGCDRKPSGVRRRMSPDALVKLQAQQGVAYRTAESGRKLQGRCFNLATGSDRGSVYGMDSKELLGDCGKIAEKPIIINQREVACNPDDSFHGCEAGAPATIACVKGGASPAAARTGQTAFAKTLDTVRSCVRVPAGTTVSSAFCNMNDNFGNDQWCGSAKGDSGCAATTSLALTLAKADTDTIYCWTARNESGDKRRRYTLSVR